MDIKKKIYFSINFKRKTTPLSKNNFSCVFSKKLKGGALFVSIFVSILIGIILSMFILIGKYNQRNITVFTQTSQLYYNLQSTFEIAQSSYFTSAQNLVWIKNSINDDSIKIKKMNWGAYLILSSETKNRHQHFTESGLYGTFMSADTGIMVSENSRAIGLSGLVNFRSNCYLPSSGIKPAYIEGQSYVSSSENKQYIKKSPTQIPTIDKTFFNDLKLQQNTSNYLLDSTVAYLQENTTQSFSHKTISWETSAPLLSNLSLRNNIKIICRDIEIDSSAHLDNILIVCNKVRFKKGFKGRLHIIARDSICMETDCQFNYPSSFVLLPKEEGSMGLKYIQFNKGCIFFGGILALTEPNGNPNLQKVFVKLDAQSEINGFIYCSDYIHFQGIVNATAICNKLLLKTPSAVYENHMLSCEVDSKKYGHLLGIPAVFKHNAKLICCKKIN